MNPTTIARSLAVLLSALLALAQGAGASPGSPPVYRIGVVGGG